MLAEKEKENRELLAERNKGLGFSQAFEFGERSNAEYGASHSLCSKFSDDNLSRRVKISELEKEVLRMAAALEINFSRPPSGR